MRQSQLFTKTQKEVGQESVAKNCQFLVKGGFVNQEMAGVYSFLPLGLRVIKKISQIIREEMEKIGGQEVFMPALHPKDNWQKTNRWEEFGALFKLRSEQGSEYALGPTHEEIIVPLARKFITSYHDLPKLDLVKRIWPKTVYQIQTKFRDEKRAKSGLLRGREFLMKDLYSFHQTPEDLAAYYEEVRQAYQKIFVRLSLNAILTEASGGTFSRLSHEFQVECGAGEDSIYYCAKCNLARNREIMPLEAKEQSGKGRPRFNCHKCQDELVELKTAEVGNIFKLNTKFSEPFELTYADEQGQQQPVYMGCYGVGISRLMGVIVEVFNDQKGIIWPAAVTPFKAHLLLLSTGDEPRKDFSGQVYQRLVEAGIEVLYDDRDGPRAGEKFAEADLIGCPYRLVVSKRTNNRVELKKRDKEGVHLLDLDQLIQELGG